jgi:hypothetical protein
MALSGAMHTRSRRLRRRRGLPWAIWRRGSLGNGSKRKVCT